MLVTQKPILTALLGAGRVDDFMTQYWPRRPYVAHGSPSRFPPSLRAAQLANVHALSQAYKGRVAFTHGRKTDKMVPAGGVPASVLFNMGLTVIFEDIGNCVPGAVDFLRGLERELGVNESCAVMSAFASPLTDGVACHYDAQDVISVQLTGTKRFHYAPVREITNPYGMQYGRGELPYEELYTQVPNGFPDETGVKFETAEMKPGSVLFLPRATWHYTEADEPSLSLSIILRPVTLVDCALEQLRWLLLQDSAWREPTYGSTATGASNKKLREHAARLLERLPAVAGSLSPEDLIGTTTPAAKRLEQISDKTRFQKIPNAVLQVDERGATRGMATVTIRLPQPETSNDFSMQMDVGTALVAVFRWIDAQRKPFTGADLSAAFPQLAAADRKKLLDLLTRAQFIKMLWFPQLPPHARVGDAEAASQ